MTTIIAEDLALNAGANAGPGDVLVVSGRRFELDAVPEWIDHNEDYESVAAWRLVGEWIEDAPIESGEQPEGSTDAN